MPLPNKCKICRREAVLVRDHDHRTNRIRGWICGHCNSGLGFFRDDTESLARAILYLNDELEYERYNNSMPVDGFPSMRAKARYLAKQLGIKEETAMSRVRREF